MTDGTIREHVIADPEVCAGLLTKILSAGASFFWMQREGDSCRRPYLGLDDVDLDEDPIIALTDAEAVLLAALEEKMSAEAQSLEEMLPLMSAPRGDIHYANPPTMGVGRASRSRSGVRRLRRRIGGS